MDKFSLSELLSSYSKYIVKGQQHNEENSQCLICLEMVDKPQQCVKCRSAFCSRCVNSWRQVHNTCPKKCSKEWVLTAWVQAQYKCPYQNCDITKARDGWQKHIQTCQQAPHHIKQTLQRQTPYCPNTHQLTPQCLPTTCSSCQTFSRCLSTCSKCDLHYCKNCRIPKFYRNVCPSKHLVCMFGSSNFSCDGCLREVKDGICAEDRQCGTKICGECRGLIKEEEEEGVGRAKVRVRSFSRGKVIVREYLGGKGGMV